MATGDSAELRALREAITDGDDDLAVAGVEVALKAGIAATDILDDAVVAGIQETGRLWNENKVYLPEVILSAEAFRAALAALKPHLQSSQTGRAGKIVIGVVKGDVHDLGKSLVSAMLAGAGFEVIDLGIDVPTATFVEKVRELQPQILGIGAYMTATSLMAAEIIEALREEGLREGVKVMVGGVSFTQALADHVGADAWGETAIQAAAKAKQLVG
jgi:corrinoid protein of di/trimethylamine methyltransferase